MSPDRPAVHMEILRADLGSCSGLAGAVVVIDVLRSFSTAAYAFAGGGSGLLCGR